MPGKVTLEVTEGPIRGRRFTFEEHETFVFGRDPSCHAKLSEDDMTASRHHFILEINPPEARVRDLGSLNGTYVNDQKYGGRDPEEHPQEASRRTFPEVDIKDGDKIQVGETVFRVEVSLPAMCAQCGTHIPDSLRTESRTDSGVLLCAHCRGNKDESTGLQKPAAPVTCERCGKEMPPKSSAATGPDKICQSCFTKESSNPIQLLLKAFASKFSRAGRLNRTDIPGYEVGPMLGPGGMGAVYLGKRLRDGREVAIKVMLSKVPVYEDARGVFKREIDVTMSLRHPNIVALYEHGSSENMFYFVMEYCAGGSVESLMKSRGGKLSIDEARPIVLQALDGLCFAHEQGFVHRDLNPKNLLLTSPKGGQTKIADLGLAKNFQTAGFSGMTVTGTTLGDPQLMPREQLLNFKHVKPVSDVWAISATLYNMVTGEFPYEVRMGLSPIDAVFEGRIVPIRDRRRNIPAKPAEVIDRALAIKVEDRYQTAREFRDALRECL
jgi:eukaryotic-like serine/threonine-protein kinase